GKAVLAGTRRAERTASVAGRRLDPDTIEGAGAHELAIGYAVERHTAGEAEVALRIFLREALRQGDHRILGDHLDRGGDVHVHLLERLVFRPRPPHEPPAGTCG